MSKNVRVLVAEVDGPIGREDLNKVEGGTFDTMDDVMKELGGNVEYYTLSEFAEVCNDTDDDGTYIQIIDIWIGHINLTEK